MPEHLLALDLGTTHVCALVVDLGGRVRGRASLPLTTRFPAPGHVEQDPAEMWARSVAVIGAALDHAGLTARDLAALGLVSQRATAIAWDAERLEPLAPAISWQDRRTAERCAELASRGLPIEPLAAASKLEWLVTRSEAVRACARADRLRMGTPDAWIAACLTGGRAVVTDPGGAGSTALFDPRRACWVPRLLETFSLEETWLPEVVPTAAVRGETTPSLFGAALPVAARAGDQQAATFAQGAHVEGTAKLTLGTSAMLDLHTGERMRRPPPGAYPLPLWQIGDAALQYCLEGAVVTAGAAVDWLVTIGVLDSAESLDAIAGGVDSSDGVTFVPALQGLGTPHMDASARGLIGGLTRGSTRAHLARALVEGLAQRCVDLCDAMALGEGPLRVDGGLAQSDLLMTALADATGWEVHRARETETSALGAAFLAGIGVGVIRGPERVRELLGAPEVFSPVADSAARSRARERWLRAIARVSG